MQLIKARNIFIILEQRIIHFCHCGSLILAQFSIAVRIPVCYADGLNISISKLDDVVINRWRILRRKVAWVVLTSVNVGIGIVNMVGIIGSASTSNKACATSKHLRTISN